MKKEYKKSRFTGMRFLIQIKYSIMIFLWVKNYSVDGLLTMERPFGTEHYQ